LGGLGKYPVCRSKVSFLFLIFGLFGLCTGWSVRQIWTGEGLKGVVLCKDMLFRELNDVPLNFRVKTPKILKFSSLNNKKIQILIT